MLTVESTTQTHAPAAAAAAWGQSIAIQDQSRKQYAGYSQPLMMMSLSGSCELELGETTKEKEKELNNIGTRLFNTRVLWPDRNGTFAHSIPSRTWSS